MADLAIINLTQPSAVSDIFLANCHNSRILCVTLLYV